MGKAFLFFLLFILSFIPGRSKAENIHQQAARCGESSTRDCQDVCSICHPSPETSTVPQAWNPEGSPATAHLPSLSIGDLPLCLGCHEEKSISGDNHPVGISYPRDRPDYSREPSGPLLFCDEGDGECRVYCSTCHDPHAWGTPGILRVNNSASALCLACHLK